MPRSRARARRRRRLERRACAALARAVRACHRARAALPARADRRRAAAGCARGRADRGDRAGRRVSRRPRCGARCCWQAICRRSGRLRCEGGLAALEAIRIEVGRPLAPMLAGSAPDAATAIERLGSAAAEWKLDGIRVQIHARDGEVSIFTRSLDDITDRLPELVEIARALPVRSVDPRRRGDRARAPTAVRCPSRSPPSRAARRTGDARALAAALRLPPPRRRRSDRPPGERARGRAQRARPGRALRAARAGARRRQGRRPHSRSPSARGTRASC